MLFSKYANEFFALESPGWKPKTQREYRQILDSRLLPEFGTKNIEGIKRQDVKRFQNELKLQGLSAATINTYMAVLRTILSGAVNDDVIKDNPALKVDREAKEDRDIQVLSLDEIKRVLAAADDHTRPLFTFLAYQGCRPGEAFALQWDCVDFENNQIKIKRNRVLGMEHKPKTSAGRRTIDMLPPVREALLRLHETRVSQHVFVTVNGQPYNRTVDKQWHAACERAGVTKRKLYCLRHSWASNCLTKGVNPVTVAFMMGHSNPAVTLSIYAHFLRDNSSIDRMKEALTV